MYPFSNKILLISFFKFEDGISTTLCLAAIEFLNLVKNRLDLEYQCHSRFNDPSAADFFKIFGIGEALVFPTADGYELAFK